jgi:hypothetical protein
MIMPVMVSFAIMDVARLCGRNLVREVKGVVSALMNDLYRTFTPMKMVGVRRPRVKNDGCDTASSVNAWQ